MSAFSRLISPPGSEMARLRAAAKRLLARIPAADSLLDIGCADGKVTLDYARIFGIPKEKISGVETQPKYLLPPHPLSIAALDIEKERFPYDDESFGVVICNQVLEHLKVVIAPLREIARVTKTGGHILIGVPNLASLVARIQLLAGQQPISIGFPGPHIRGFTHEALKNFFAANPNLELVATTGSSLYPFPPPALEGGARLWPGLACYTLYLLKKTRHAPHADWPADQFPDESVTG